MGGKSWKDDDDQESKPLNNGDLHAPDGGWGWFCVLGCTFMHAFVIGTEGTFGLVYVELREMFHQSAALTAWVGSLGIALRMGLGPVAAMLVNCFSYRKVVMVGGCIFFTGLVLSSFPPNLGCLYFTWSTLVGIGGALVYAPGLICIGQYFDKRRAVANGISTAGGGMGLFSMPQLFTALLYAYGYHGALLVFGALTFNLVVCGALFRPLHATKTQRNGSLQEECNNSHSTKCNIAEDSNNIRSLCNKDIKIESIMNEKAGIAVKDNRFYGAVNGKTETGSDDARNEKEVNGDIVMNGKGDGSGESLVKKEKNMYLDYRLLCDPTFILFGIYVGFCTQAYVPTPTFLPALAVSRGLNKYDATLLMSVVGVSDMTGRIGSGVIFDIRPVQKLRRYVYGFASFSLAISLVAFPSAEEFWEYVIVCIFYGLSVGTFLSQIPCLLADWLGKESLSSAIGLATLFRGIGVMMGPVIGGLLKDMTGSYGTAFYFSAVASFCGCVSYLTLIALYETRRRRQYQPEPLADD